jgi:hypothetical protein
MPLRVTALYSLTLTEPRLTMFAAVRRRGSVPPQHAQSRFLKVAVVSRFLAKHPTLSKFIGFIAPGLCPFLPMPGAEIPTPPAPRPRGSRFIP